MRFLLHDLRYAARSLWISKAITVATIVLLGLGIGLNSVLFSIADAVLLDVLSYPQSGRLVVLHWRGMPRNQADVTAQAYFLVKDGSHLLTDVTALAPSGIGVNMAWRDKVTFAQTLPVSRNFFSALRVSPLLGRDFQENDNPSQHGGSAVLSYRFWSQLLGRRPDVIGENIQINNRNYLVTGVMREDFQSFPDADIWLLLDLSPGSADVGSDYRVIARMRDGAGMREVQEELKALSERAHLSSPAGSPRVLVGEKLKEFISADVKLGVIILFGAALFVLLIACLNIALLVAARSLARTHEVATRIAFGSPRSRIVRMFLCESVVLALAGGLLGLILAKESLGLVVAFVPRALLTGAPVRINFTVLVFTALVSTATALLFGLGPALRMSHANINKLLKSASRGVTHSRSESSTGKLLVAGQAAITLVLLTGAFLLLQSFRRLEAVDIGFDPNLVWVAQILVEGGPGNEQKLYSARIERILDELRKGPSTEVASSTTSLPMENGLNMPAHPAGSPDRLNAADYQIVTPGYFQTLRIALLAGRDFTDGDSVASRPVAIINQTLASQWWPGKSALGETLQVSVQAGEKLADRPRVIVGVASDIRASGLDQPPPATIFIPASQTPDGLLAFVNRFFLTSIVVRTRGTNFPQNFQRIIGGEDRDLTLASLRPLTHVIAASVERPRFYAILSSAFAVIALILTAIGVYGMLRHDADTKSREIGLRMVLGANRGQAVRFVIMRALKPMLVGVMFGILGSLIMAKVLMGLLYNPGSVPTGTILDSAAVLAFVAGSACGLIGFQVARIDPGDLLRGE